MWYCKSIEIRIVLSVVHPSKLPWPWYHSIDEKYLFHARYHFYILLHSTLHLRASFCRIRPLHHELSHLYFIYIYLHRKSNTIQYLAFLDNHILPQVVQVYRWILSPSREIHLGTIALHKLACGYRSRVFRTHSFDCLSSVRRSSHHLDSRKFHARFFSHLERNLDIDLHSKNFHQ